MHANQPTCIPTHTHTNTCANTRTHTRTRTHTHAHTHTHTYIHMHTCTHMHIHTHAHAHTHTHKHIHTHTHTHTWGESETDRRTEGRHFYTCSGSRKDSINPSLRFMFSNVNGCRPEDLVSFWCHLQHQPPRAGAAARHSQSARVHPHCFFQYY